MTLLKFFKKNDYSVRFYILITLFELPGMLFHELCHIIGAILTFSKVKKIEVPYFYKIERNYLKSYMCNVHTSTSGIFIHLRMLMINIAPAIGILILLLIDLRFLYWIVPSIKTFWLSKQDIENATYNWKHLKTK